MHRRAVRNALLVTAITLAAHASPAAAYTISSPTAAEGDELVFTVSPELGDNPLSDQFDPQSGTATEGADFDGTARGASPVVGGFEVRVPTVEDGLDEPDETVVLVAPDGDSGTGTITDDDPTPALAVKDVGVSEGAGEARVTVTASAPSGGAIGFDVGTRDATASAGSDYQAPAARASIPAGARSADVVVPINQDGDDENDEALFLTISNPAGATIGDGEGIVVILNDDLRAVSVADTTVRELDGDRALARFLVTLNAPTFRTVTVDYTTGDGLARSPRDFTARAGALTIPAGQTRQLIDVSIAGDNDKEPPEAFAVWLTKASGARIGDGVAAGVIADDDGGANPDTSDKTPPRMAFTRLRRRGGRITTRARCPRAERVCSGRLTLFTAPDPRSGSRTLRRERRVGARSFSIRGGRAATVRIRVPRRIASAARRAGRLRLRGFAVTQDAGANVDTRTLRATLRYGRRSR